MLLGIDQVLLDMVVGIDHDPEILERHDLKPNTQQLANEMQAPLIADFRKRLKLPDAEECHARGKELEGTPPKNRADGGKEASSTTKRPRHSPPSDLTVAPVIGTPGGVIANSLRGASWWLRRRRRGLAQASTSALASGTPALKALGIVGRDNAGLVVKHELHKMGVELIDAKLPEGYLESQNVSYTGVCLCLVRSQQRTMLVDLGISRVAIPEMVECIANQERACAATTTSATQLILLSSGFYVQADPHGTKALRDWCNTYKRGYRPAVALTLGAEWCCGHAAVQEAARAADFVFGNEVEFLQLCSNVQVKADAEMTDHAAKSARDAIVALAAWKQYGWLVMTRGSQEVLAIQATETPLDSDVISVPVPYIDPAQVVDDVGAGDAFMGGFLVCAWGHLDAALKNINDMHASVAERMSPAAVEAAMRAGISTAAFALTGVGCQFPEKSDAPSPRLVRSKLASRDLEGGHSSPNSLSFARACT